MDPDYTFTAAISAGVFGLTFASKIHDEKM
jgi:hypothetical protein